MDEPTLTGYSANGNFAKGVKKGKHYRTRLGCPRTAYRSVPGPNAKSCSCEEAMKKRMGVVSVVEDTGASQGCKQPTPLTACSEYVTEAASHVTVEPNDRSGRGLVHNPQMVTSRRELCYVSPGPLRDGSDPSALSDDRKCSSSSPDSRPHGFPILLTPASNRSCYSNSDFRSLSIVQRFRDLPNVFEEPVSNSNVPGKSSESSESNPPNPGTHNEFTFEPSGSGNIIFAGQNADENGVEAKDEPHVMSSVLVEPHDASQSFAYYTADEPTEYEGQGELQEYSEEEVLITVTPSEKSLKHSDLLQKNVENLNETQLSKDVLSPSEPTREEIMEQDNIESLGQASTDYIEKYRREYHGNGNGHGPELIEELPSGRRIPLILASTDNDLSDTSPKDSEPAYPIPKKGGQEREPRRKKLSVESVNESDEEFIPTTNNNLVMVLRVEDDQQKKLCPSMMKHEQFRAERTRRWIEDIPQGWIVESRTKLERASQKNPRPSTGNDMTTLKYSGIANTSELSVRKRYVKNLHVTPEYSRKKRSGSVTVRYRSPVRKRPSLKDKRQKHGRNSEDLEHRKKRNQSPEKNYNARSDEDIGTSMKKLLHGMCFMGPLGKAKNIFKSQQVVAAADHARDEPGPSKAKATDYCRETIHTIHNKAVHGNRRRNKPKTYLGENPITMPVSQVKIIDHGHGRREFGNTERSSKDDVTRHHRFGERCRHEECEKMRSPATLWDMLEKTRKRNSERANDYDRRASNRRRYDLRKRSSSSEDSVVNQRLMKARDRVVERYVSKKAGHKGRGYLLDTGLNRTHGDHTPQLTYHDHRQTIGDHDHRQSHAHDDLKPEKLRPRVKRRAVLRDSTSSDSSSEALVINEPNKIRIMKPQAKVEFIQAGPRKKRVTLSPPQQYPDRPDYNPRFERASKRESLRRKRHAQLIREVLKFNESVRSTPSNHSPLDSETRHRRHIETKSKKKRDSESRTSSGSSVYTHHFVRSVPENTKRDQQSREHARPKSLGNPRDKKGLSSAKPISKRLITSSESKSSAGFEQLNVKDFVDFLVTLSRNTIGTLTNKKKAVRLYKSYLKNEYDGRQMRKRVLGPYKS